jgi:Xaa-Pro dipeptidase
MSGYYKYKHAVARGKRLKQYGMLNLCSRKVGTGHFHYAVHSLWTVAGGVGSALQIRSAGECGAIGCSRAWAPLRLSCSAWLNRPTPPKGFPGEEKFHHQGGSTGYGEREWVATPNGTEVVVNNQAFAWNPSIRGGKTEDTVILRDGKIEWLTETAELPVIEATANGKVYPAAGVLVK